MVKYSEIDLSTERPAILVECRACYELTVVSRIEVGRTHCGNCGMKHTGDERIVERADNV